MTFDQEEILKSIENMQRGARAKLESRLQGENATLCELIPINEGISIGSPLFIKGPTYWNAIIIKIDGQERMYRISEYLDKGSAAPISSNNTRFSERGD